MPHYTADAVWVAGLDVGLGAAGSIVLVVGPSLARRWCEQLAEERPAASELLGCELVGVGVPLEGAGLVDDSEGARKGR